MASGGKRKTTMAKLNRESKLREKRQDKLARKNARKFAAENPDSVLGEDTALPSRRCRRRTGVAVPADA